MRIVMMTNTFLPMVGGVSRSVAWFSEAFREVGHDVLVVAPQFDDKTDGETDVVRIPAIRHFNGSDFSVGLPVPGILLPVLEQFDPEIIHAHHPFLLGDTALRVAASFNIPAVFTHHTMYEQYTHYVPGNSEVMRHFAVHLATEFANLCDHVIAPSESVEAIIRSRGVLTPITTIPTGIDTAAFAEGSREAGRRAAGLPADAEVVGHVGRLAVEKNLPFLADGVAAAIRKRPRARFLVVGEGPASAAVRGIFEAAGCGRQLLLAGRLEGRALADAYAAMDLFAFASRSETQGLVLAEAMAAGLPVVALDAPGARDVVEDGRNGRLLSAESGEQEFAAAVAGLLDGGESIEQFREAARRTAAGFDRRGCGSRLLDVYRQLLGNGHRAAVSDRSPLAAAWRRLGEEWDMLAGKSAAAADALAAAFFSR